MVFTLWNLCFFVSIFYFIDVDTFVFSIYYKNEKRSIKEVSLRLKQKTWLRLFVASKQNQTKVS